MCTKHDIGISLNICSTGIEYIQCMCGIIIGIIDIIFNLCETSSSNDKKFIIIQASDRDESAFGIAGFEILHEIPKIHFCIGSGNGCRHDIQDFINTHLWCHELNMNFVIFDIFNIYCCTNLLRNEREIHG